MAPGDALLTVVIKSLLLCPMSYSIRKVDLFCSSIMGKKWRAISWTTAASIAAVVEMVADQKLPQKGFLKQEEIDFSTFLETQNGQLFKG